MENFLIYIIKFLRKIKHDDIFSISAQFSYYIILGIFPFIFILMSLLGRYSSFIYELLLTVESLIPHDVYKIIYNIADDSINSFNTTYLQASIVALIWSASSGSVGIIRGINKAYDCPVKSNFIAIRIKGIFFTISLIFSLQLSFVFIIAGKQLILFLQKISILTNYIFIVINITRYLIPILIFFLIFSFTYRFLPCEKVKYKSIISGALFATLGCVIGSMLFSLYIDTKIMFYNNIYGNLSGFFIFIIWIYLSSFIFLLGAEINAFNSKKKNN